MSEKMNQDLRELVDRFDAATARCRREGDEAWDDLNDALGKILIMIEDHWQPIVAAYLAAEEKRE